MTDKQQYRALDDGWIAGRRVRKGEIVEMTEAEARYEPAEPARKVKIKAGGAE